MVEISAYATDCRVLGELALDGRLSDLLNECPAIVLTNVRVRALADGHGPDLDDLEVGRDELCAVVAREPRGDPGRRIHTRLVPVEAEVGPYLIEGYAHSTPASDPLTQGLRRTAWLPVTSATVRYWSAGQLVVDRVDALIVNRRLAVRFEAAPV